MESLLLLLLLYLFFVLLILPVWMIVRLRRHQRELDTVHDRQNTLEQDNRRLRQLVQEVSRPAPSPSSAAPASVPPSPGPATPAPPTLAPPETETDEPFSRPTPIVPGGIRPPEPTESESGDDDEVIEPPPLGRPPVTAPIPAALLPVAARVAEPSLGPGRTPSIPPPLRQAKPAINWEQFFGAKFFAWAGGLALFLCVAFFVKYSFEHDLIPPEARVAIGFLLGTGLIVGGLKLVAGRYRVVAQALVATGVVSLYAVTFACNAVYHFQFFGLAQTFALMALITTAAFLIAVRIEAQVVAILGMLGGFLTPILLSTGVDNPGGLFGYIALLDLGLAAAALHRRWPHLVGMAAIGTVFMMMGWSDEFYSAAKTPVAMIVCLGFSVLFVAVHHFARRLGRPDRWITVAAVGLPFVAYGFAFLFNDYPAAAGRAGLFLGYVLAVDVVLLVLAWLDPALRRVHAASGLAAFVILGLWTGSHLTDERLLWALGAYLAFAALHTAFPMLLLRRADGDNPRLAWWDQAFPPLALLLMLQPVNILESVSFLLWPAILLVDLIAIGLAVASASIVGIAAVLVLTLIATGMWILKIPTGLALEPGILMVIGGFAAFFFAISLWVTRKLADRLPATEDAGPLTALFGDARTQIPAFSSLLPFLLLVMVCNQLAVPNPGTVFGLALLLVALTLGLTRLMAIEWLPACALAGAAAVEFAWFSRQFDPSAAQGYPLIWFAVFYVGFALFPFLFAERFRSQRGPWVVAALSGVMHFPLFHRLIERTMPNDVMGLLPAAFAVTPLLSLVAVLRKIPANEPRRLDQLAWFGAVALLFITLVFPIQFDRQWLTVAWALEGAALFWLFRRVPHPGLRWVGSGLLAIAFARLAVNPEIFAYRMRGDTPLLNWYLCTYGLVIAALFGAAKLAGAPGEFRIADRRVSPGFQGLGVVLAFILLNIEIADWFTPIGARSVGFRFSAGFAQDTTYTIAWALFALGLLSAGLLKRLRAARWAGIGLLCVALLKLFLHDLARLDSLYRIGALFGVALVAIGASFAYQKFLPSDEDDSSPSA